MSEEHKIKLLENYISEHKKMTDSMIEILQQENTQLKQEIKNVRIINHSQHKRILELEQQLKELGWEE